MSADEGDDKLLRELAGLKAAAPEPRSDFADAVMRQLATRPLPKPSLWRRLFAAREVTFRVRPLPLLAGACAMAVVVIALRPRPPVATVTAQAGTHPHTHAATHEADEPDRPVMVRFALAAPKAAKVALAGDFNGWRAERTPMQRGADGVWSIEVPLSHGNWSYSFVVDGKWVEDPLADSWRDDGFGGRNAVVRVGLAEAHVTVGETPGG